MEMRSSINNWTSEHPNLTNIIIVGLTEGMGGMGPNFRFDISNLKTNFKKIEIKSFGQRIYQGSRNLLPYIKKIENGNLEFRRIYENRENFLPKQKDSYYKEYEIPTPGWNKPGAGPERIIKGNGGEYYYSPNHYTSKPIKLSN